MTHTQRMLLLEIGKTLAALPNASPELRKLVAEAQEEEREWQRRRTPPEVRAYGKDR